MRSAKLCSLLVAILLWAAPEAFSQSGKISGTITDAQSGETLPGVNVVIEGSLQGAVTNASGFYFINNVRPGTYTLQASFIGYVTVHASGVRVSTGLTTEQDFTLQSEAVGLDEVTVTAERPIVQLDVSANVASLTPESFEDLPVAGVSEVLDLQAGIEPGLQVRGGGIGEVAFVLDGLNLRTGRSNEPLTNISYTSLEEVQVQTGGFNAEYGNVRSGIVNVTTKEPPRDRYIFDGLFRIAPAQDKALNALEGNLGSCDFSSSDLSSDCDSWYARPALDPAVAFDGTDSWDQYTQRQYNAFEGWNAVAERLRNDEGFDVTPQDMRDYFLFTHRKDNQIDIPDYEADFTVGGPLVPGMGDKARFLFSYRGTQTAYTLPQGRDSFDDNLFQLKLVSNLASGMKLSVQGFKATERGVNSNRNLPEVRVWKGNLPSYPWQNLLNGTTLAESQADQAPGTVEPVVNLSRRGVFLFSDGGLALADIDHTMIGGTFTHTLSAKTFYEVNLQNISSKYRSKFPNLRDGSFVEDGVFTPVLFTDNFGMPNGRGDVTCFGGTSDLNGDGQTQGYCVGEEPFGFAGVGGNLLTGETTGGHWVKTRDTTDVSVFTGRFSLTSQLSDVLEIKTGAELILNDIDSRFARVNLALIGPEPEEAYPFSRNPIQGAAFAQSKLEFKGMIANLGFRLDYFDPNVEWWVFDSYDQALRGRIEGLDENLETVAQDAQVSISPRLGISFPISENTKLYFNYGHFRQVLNPLVTLGVQQSRDGGIDVIGNPQHPMPNTVAYELGFDQNLFDQFLLRISGFYRDIRNQPRVVNFNSLGGVVDYNTLEPWNYEDVRGLEFSLTKNRGGFIRGFLNYTYLQTKDGNFGFANFFENSFQQRNYLRTSTDYRINSPLAQPYARANLTFLSPADKGALLGDWRLSFLGEWRAGEKLFWDGLNLGSGGSNIPELQENVQWANYWNFDLRLTKHLDLKSIGTLQVFADVANVFNIKSLYRFAAFHPDNNDLQFYMESLHLPEDIFSDLNNQDALPYIWIPGDDRPGDIRDENVAFQPIEAVASLDNVEPNETAWYWAQDSGTFSRWNGSAFEQVPQGEVDQVIDDKAYIDMPNLRFNTFLNPRRVTFGVRLSF